MAINVQQINKTQWFLEELSGTTMNVIKARSTQAETGTWRIHLGKKGALWKRYRCVFRKQKNQIQNVSTLKIFEAIFFRYPYGNQRVWQVLTCSDGRNTKIIPRALQQRVLGILYAAHQGASTEEGCDPYETEQEKWETEEKIKRKKA